MRWKDSIHRHDPSGAADGMFWFNRKRFVRSYGSLTSTRRSQVALEYASRTPRLALVAAESYVGGRISALELRGEGGHPGVVHLGLLGGLVHGGDVHHEPPVAVANAVPSAGTRAIAPPSARISTARIMAWDVSSRPAD